jgi:hypothetical protein
MRNIQIMDAYALYVRKSLVVSKFLSLRRIFRCSAPLMNKTSKKMRGGPRKNKDRRGNSFGISNAGDSIVKRLTFPSILATGAGTAIPVTQFTSGGVQSLPATEFASFAARYQEYRVRAIRITGKAVLPIQSATAAHSALYVADVMGALAPSSSTQILSDERCTFNPTFRDFRKTINFNGYPNAQLWTATNVPIPTQNQYQIVCASAPLPVMTTATTYYSVIEEWDVEFRGSQ